MKIWVVPIEPFEERYSSQWALWFKSELTLLGVDFTFINGETLTDRIEMGSFLDVCGTNYYKASQLMQLAELLYEGEIKQGDIILFHDLWFPGLEMLAYIRQGLGIDLKITGCLHAGSWDEYDFLTRTGMSSWATAIERGWFNFIDLAFVATHFHKYLITETHHGNMIANKIKVTGFPMYFPAIETHEKEDIIVFPHRLDPEKQPNFFDYLKDYFRNSGWKFIKTKEQWNGEKNLYYDILGRSKIAVSFALQETWGIAMQEALFYGCIPFVPDRLSYSEMYLPEFKFSNTQQIIQMIHTAIDRPEKYADSILQNQVILEARNHQAISNIIEEVHKLCNQNKK